MGWAFVHPNADSDPNGHANEHVIADQPSDFNGYANKHIVADQHSDPDGYANEHVITDQYSDLNGYANEHIIADQHPDLNGYTDEYSNFYTNTDPNTRFSNMDSAVNANGKPKFSGNLYSGYFYLKWFCGASDV